MKNKILSTIWICLSKKRSDDAFNKVVYRIYKYLFAFGVIVIGGWLIIGIFSNDSHLLTISEERKIIISNVQNFIKNFNSNEYNQGREQYNDVYALKNGILTGDQKQLVKFNDIHSLQKKHPVSGQFLIVTTNSEGSLKKINSKEAIIIEVPNFGKKHDDMISVGYADGIVETYSSSYIFSLFRNYKEIPWRLEKDYTKEALFLLKTDKLIHKNDGKKL